MVLGWRIRPDYTLFLHAGLLFHAQVAATNSLGTGTESALTSTAVAAFKPAIPTSLVAAGGPSRATLTYAPATGAVWYEARILAATSAWAVTTTELVPFAPCPLSTLPTGCTAVRTVTVGAASLRSFDVPLSAFRNRAGQYTFQVRAVDTNGVPGDWSAASDGVTVGKRNGCFVHDFKDGAEIRLPVHAALRPCHSSRH